GGPGGPCQPPAGVDGPADVGGTARSDAGFLGHLRPQWTLAFAAPRRVGEQLLPGWGGQADLRRLEQRLGQLEMISRPRLVSGYERHRVSLFAPAHSVHKTSIPIVTYGRVCCPLVHDLRRPLGAVGDYRPSSDLMASWHSTGE